MHGAYKKFAKQYDLIFSQKDYEGEISFIKQMVKKTQTGSEAILDVGCGTGKHLGMLKNTFKARYGVDLNSEILQAAKENYPEVTFQNNGMAEFQFDTKFDVITCLYSVFNYNLTVEEAQKTLNNFKKHLNKDGLVVIAFYKPTNTDKKMTMHSGKDDTLEIVKFNQYKYNPKTKMEEASFVVLSKDNEGKIDFTVESDHKYRVYDLDEIKNMLKETGFESIQIFDGFSEDKADENTKYPVAIGRV